MFKKDDVVVSVSVLFKKKDNGGYEWFLTKKSGDDEWDFPRVFAKKGESSVRAAMRTLSEQAGIDAKVLEESARARVVISSSGKPMVQQQLFYLVQYLGGEEILEFAQTDWVPYANAIRRLRQKREQNALRNANKTLKEIERNNPERLEIVEG